MLLKACFSFFVCHWHQKGLVCRHNPANGNPRSRSDLPRRLPLRKKVQRWLHLYMLNPFRVPLLKPPASTDGLFRLLLFRTGQNPAWLFRELVMHYSKFMMKLYIWLSTTKWMGRQERRSCVAGSQVSQERALYCSSTNLMGEQNKEIGVIMKTNESWGNIHTCTEIQ